MERPGLSCRFFETNYKYIDQPFWREAGLDPEKPNISAERVAKEAIDLASYIHELAKNTEAGNCPILKISFNHWAVNIHIFAN